MYLYFVFIVKDTVCSICMGIFLKCVISTMYPVLTQQEKLLLANRERDKGNDAFRANDYEEAVAYYSRSAHL